VKEDRPYLEDIREAIRKIVSYSADGWEEFSRDTMIQDAVLRNFEIIGEAAKRLSEAVKSRRPDVPWRDIAGFRDVLIHNYMGVNLKRVWNVIQQNLPGLQQAIDELLHDK
jgi:uncharacterized protein with HEPN domain